MSRGVSYRRHSVALKLWVCWGTQVGKSRKRIRGAVRAGMVPGK